MPSYRLEQAFFTLSASMTIADAEGTPRFRVEGEWLRSGVTLTDLVTQEAVELQQEVFSMKVCWHVVRSGEVVATFEKAGWFSQTYVLDVPGPNDFTIQQQAMVGFDAVVTRPHAGQVARVHKPGWLSTGLQIDIEPGQDDLLIVACAAILLMLRQQS